MNINAHLYRQDDRRHEDRVLVERAGTLRLAEHPPESITIADLTRDGCRIDAPVPLAPGTQIGVGIAGVGVVRAEVRWRNGSEHGCAFAEPLRSGAVTAALMSNVHPFPGSAEPVAASSKLSVGTSSAALFAIAASGWGVVAALLWLVD
ncbi:PilZ domain-containing protein [Sphingomonas hankookensis]|uniref:PilZ domain-containing protein n=1 Tax=Sphingomonas hankookensis TaxID=563996 RepID=UPI00234F27B6|nr:PilZ domain-containing protein [Sphingomonas hankookensis]WCP71916.1 PilZ domain-containing protein [Sphingomonas hankookensis]